MNRKISNVQNYGFSIQGLSFRVKCNDVSRLFLPRLVAELGGVDDAGITFQVNIVEIAVVFSEVNGQ